MVYGEYCSGIIMCWCRTSCHASCPLQFSIDSCQPGGIVRGDSNQLIRSQPAGCCLSCSQCPISCVTPAPPGNIPTTPGCLSTVRTFSLRSFPSRAALNTTFLNSRPVAVMTRLVSTLPQALLGMSRYCHRSHHNPGARHVSRRHTLD